MAAPVSAVMHLLAPYYGQAGCVRCCITACHAQHTILENELGMLFCGETEYAPHARGIRANACRLNTLNYMHQI